MVTVVCDAAKISLLLDKADQCATLKTVVKIGSPVTEEEKSRGEKLNIRIINFTELEVGVENHLFPLNPRLYNSLLKPWVRYMYMILETWDELTNRSSYINKQFTKYFWNKQIIWLRNISKLNYICHDI